MARPTKLTAELTQEIATTLRRGHYIETAASFNGIDKQTFYNWVNRGRAELKRVAADPRRLRVRKGEAIYVGFFDAVEKASAQGEVLTLARIERAGVDGVWQADAWRLERRYPAKWGRRERRDTAALTTRPVVAELLDAMRQNRNPHNGNGRDHYDLDASAPYEGNGRPA